MVNPTTLPLVKKKLPVESEAETRCRAQGGRWDAVNQVCILPEPAREQLERPPSSLAPETDARGFEVFRHSETGRLTGIDRPGKKPLHGLPPSEVRALAAKEANLQDLPAGSTEESSLAATEERQAKAQSQGFDLASQVGVQPPQNELEQLQSQISAGNVDYLGALFSTAPGIIPDLLTGAAAGATAALIAGQAGPQVALPEEIATVPAAATILGLVNVVKGVYSDFVSDVKRQKREIIETPIRTLTETKSILNDITGAQNSNPEDAVDNLAAFNNQLAIIDLEYARLKEETDSDLNKFLGDTGVNQLQEYEVYYLTDGERQRQIDDFALALANPDPARIRPSTVTLAKIKEAIRKELE